MNAGTIWPYFNVKSVFFIGALTHTPLGELRTFLRTLPTPLLTVPQSLKNPQCQVE